MANTNDVNALAEIAQRHAEAIMKAAGSSLKHYETISKARILGAVMDLIDETYRMGSERGISYVLAKQREATATRDTGGEG